MNRRHTLLFTAGCAFLATAAMGQDRAVPRSGSGGQSSGAGARHTPSVSSSSRSGSSGSSSSSGAPAYSPTQAERRHPRAGTGTGARYGGYRPGRPIYPGNPGWGWGGSSGWGWGGYHPAYWGYWWPYASPGWGPYWGSAWGAGAVYTYAQTDRGSIRVLVDPTETRVYVDGYYAGVVDDFDGLFQRLNVAPGRHEISLKLTGFQTHRLRVYVGSGATVKLDHEMKKGAGETYEDLAPDAPRREARQAPSYAPAPVPERAEPSASGKLHLQVSPVDASVYVDGEFRGTGREATMLALPPGQHRVEVVRPGYRTAERDIEVASQGVAELTVDLTRP
jgi:hypothetical protein